ncbi:MAG: DEAD/DEAH box helicase [Thaumarchaeota archaeon]|nr:DEAD/DEAH box helicase [Candidatus Calditenuaceae archaeon]MDW8187502.1 DEAD/DEAH box helicase [Nitrososphaerota archaeon]
MEVDDLRVSEGMKRALRSEGIERLYPHQVEAIEKGLMEGRNMVVSAPTASGKTLLAVLAAYRHLSEGRKVLYLTPLRALTTEKVAEFSSLFQEAGMNVKVRAASGDYDDRGDWLADSDLVVATYEKADSLVRHRARWLGDVRLVVVDEVHMIGDGERGPTLEMTVAKLMEVFEEPQMLCLSATIRNAEEIARWLDAGLVRSDFRPVPLKEGVLVEREGEIVFPDGSSRPIGNSGDGLLAAVKEGLRDDGQVLVFAMTRKRAEGYASRIANSLLEMGDSEVLTRYAARALEDRESPVSEVLASLIARGLAFHHAGLSFFHRSLIEDAFRSRALKVLCATTTLAAGVNLPARTVVIPEYRKYTGRGWSEELSVMEYKQLCGRAGRPKYDRVGYAILLAKSGREAEKLMSEYVLGEPERVWSALASERHLRSHVLSLIASGIAKSENSLFRTLGRSFFAHQHGTKVLSSKVEPVLEFLEENGMMRRSEVLEVTPLGKRVSELYIDPLTAVRIMELTSGDVGTLDLTLLQLIAMVPDMQDVPKPGVPKSVVSETL